MRFLPFVALLFLSAACAAQDPADIFHATIDLDSINSFSFEAYQGDQLEFQPWPGDDLLLETNVKINNGEAFVLDFYQKQRRWDFKQERQGDRLQLTSRNMQRQAVKNKDQTISSETVRIVIYVPEDFEASGERAYQRKSR